MNSNANPSKEPAEFLIEFLLEFFSAILDEFYGIHY